MWNESTLRPPAVCQSLTSIARPIPVSTAVELIGECSDLNLVWSIAVEVGVDCQCTREEKCGINRRQFTLPNASTGFDVQEVIEKSFVARGVGFCALWALK